MCGIVAILSSDRPVDTPRLERGIDAIRHRGPDGQGTWISPDGHVGLGHARLSIIDLAGGAQPIASEDGQTQIVVNGEFYGYEPIQAELEQRGHRLATRSDSEIALHLYEDFGVECLRHLRGEFAFVVWDAKNQALVAARDRFGIKPLYYARRPEGWYFASEAKALFAMGVPAEWDAESFYLSCHAPLSDDRTLFSGVRQVPPGHCLIATTKSVHLTGYWDWNYDLEAAATHDDDEQVAAGVLARNLEEAVRLRLRADVPVGVYLSGGIDSSAVLGLASKLASRPLDVFTIWFSDESTGEQQHFDETAIAEETARFCGANYHPVPVSSQALAENFAAAVTHSETLHWNPHGVAKFLLSKAVRQAKMKVVLTGEGADELLLGYPWFQLDHLRPYREALRHAALARTLKLGLGLTVEDEETVCTAINDITQGIRSALGFVPWSMIIEAWFAVHLRSLMAEDVRSQFAAHDPYKLLLAGLERLDALEGRELPRQSAYLWAKSAFPNYILNVLADRMEMAHSIEGRVPFLDHHVVDGSKNTPLSTLFKGTAGKQVLRTATRDVLTSTVAERRKFPFVAPPPRRDGEDRFSEMVQDELRSSTLESLPFFDAKAVRQLIDSDRQKDLPSRWAYGHGRILTQIASACVLHRSYRL